MRKLGQVLQKKGRMSDIIPPNDCEYEYEIFIELLVTNEQKFDLAYLQLEAVLISF